jgi:hypothetical protein
MTETASIAEREWVRQRFIGAPQLTALTPRRNAPCNS